MEFSCEICENFKNTCFEEHLRKTASKKNFVEDGNFLFKIGVQLFS